MTHPTSRSWLLYCVLQCCLSVFVLLGVNADCYYESRPSHCQSESSESFNRSALCPGFTADHLVRMGVYYSSKPSLHLQSNKKFELMLTRRAKAYSSCCLQTVCLSPAISTRLLRGTAIWCSRAQISLNLENRDLDRRNLRSFLKISYAACPCLFQLVSAQFALEMCLAARNRQKIHKNLYFSAQGHPRSLNSVAIKSQCTTSY